MRSCHSPSPYVCSPEPRAQAGRHASDLGRAVRLLDCGGVLVVGEGVPPFGVAFGEGEVGHESGGCGAVPVPLAGRGDDDVAGPDPDGLPAAAWTKLSPSVTRRVWPRVCRCHAVWAQGVKWTAQSVMGDGRSL